MQRLDQHYDGVLGTSLDLTIYAADLNRMETAAAMVVEEISRLEQILSTYREDSELMQLNRTRSSSQASGTLLDVVRHCEDWFDRTGGNFSCRLGQVLALWDAAEENQQIPSIVNMLPPAKAASEGEITLNPEQQFIELDAAISLEPSGLAKGYIIDKAMALLRRELPQAPAIKVDIGGDASYWGAPPGENGWLVHAADPQAIADNGNYITSVSLNSRAIATSGHTSRTRSIASRQFSHILVPQRGWPVANGIYAVVVAPDALTADAVATALAVQSIGAGIAWVDSVDDVEALLIDTNGTQRASRNWQTLLSEDLLQKANARIELTMNFTIPDINERDYERPYVAVWISDAEGRAIKNLLLLGGEERWARTNSRWWRSASDLRMYNVTRPTRGPGEYQLTWDGRDDYGV
ncbi:MAG: DUF2271 domain-containing protein, partial [Pseudohongiellaceae bacterium]